MEYSYTDIEAKKFAKDVITCSIDLVTLVKTDKPIVVERSQPNLFDEFLLNDIHARIHTNNQMADSELLPVFKYHHSRDRAVQDKQTGQWMVVSDDELFDGIAIRKAMRAAAKFPPIFTHINTVDKTDEDLVELNKMFYAKAQEIIIDVNGERNFLNLDDEQAVFESFLCVLKNWKSAQTRVAYL